MKLARKANTGGVDSTAFTCLHDSRAPLHRPVQPFYLNRWRARLKQRLKTKRKHSGTLLGTPTGKLYAVPSLCLLRTNLTQTLHPANVYTSSLIDGLSLPCRDLISSADTILAMANTCSAVVQNVAGLQVS